MHCGILINMPYHSICNDQHHNHIDTLWLIYHSELPIGLHDWSDGLNAYSAYVRTLPLASINVTYGFSIFTNPTKYRYL